MRFNLFKFSDSFYLLAFFIVVISAGAVLLMLPGAMRDGSLINVHDAFFTAASAVCNAGLATISLSDLNFSHKLIVLFLIQIGGLGIIAFNVVLITIPGHRISFDTQSSIQSYYLDGVEYNPRKIVRNILFFTFVIEFFGAVLLSLIFIRKGVPDPIFNGIFHDISAFCNTGLSIFPDQLEHFKGSDITILVFLFIVLLGNIGFIVIHDVLRCIRRKKKKLSYHSKIVLGMTAGLIVTGTLLFFIMERNHSYKNLTFSEAFMNALFQTINTRSAGFDFIDQTGLTQTSKLLSVIFMFIGGAPGSIAGGIKLTTAFVLIFVIFKRPDSDGDVNVFKGRITRHTIHQSTVYLVKAVALLFMIILLLSITETRRGAKFDEIVFDSVSAFGTVGLSMGLCDHLSDLGKWIIIYGMFAGRVGLIALAFPIARPRRYDISYPEATLLL